MKKILALSLFASALLFHGCGGGGGGGGSSSSSTTMVTKTLVDSQISGVSYSCGSSNSITSEQGEFTCPLDSTVSFKIGGITLGSLSITSSSPSIITPSLIFGQENSETPNANVIKFLRFVQSLDEDNDPLNGIKITSSIRDNLKDEKNLTNLDSSELENLVKTATKNPSKTLRSEVDAINHYSSTLTNVIKAEPLFNTQWALAKNDDYYSRNSINNNAHIQAVSDSYNTLYIYKGRGVKIAVIDDGIDENHEDLKTSIVEKYSTENNDENVAHNSGERHGTAVTGIIAANKNNLGILGIAPEAQIMFIKLQDGLIDASEFVEAFQKAQDWGADIINCSWGTGNVSNLLKAKIEDLADNGRAGKGTVIVFASGNGGLDQIGDDMGNDEGNIEKVLSVGATGKSNDKTAYSNFGTNLDILAPGGEFLGITTTNPAPSSEKYALPDSANSFEGTSAAAPIMSAVVALMLEKNPNLTRVQIENYIKDNADKIGSVSYTDTSGSGKDNWHSQYAHGKVNVKKILDAIPSL